MLLEVAHQCLAVSAALIGLAQAVDLKAHMAAFDQPELAPQGASHQDHFDIDIRPGKAQRLDIQLVELAIAALLRPLVAKHRAHGPDAQRAVVQRVVLDHGPYDAGSSFGAQGQLVAVHRIGEGVHLFLDDVGDLAQAAHKERGRLDDGRQQVLVAVAGQHVAHC